MASPAFNSETGTQSNAIGVSTGYILTGAIPAHSNGDLLVAVLGISDNVNNPMVEVVTPAGWTKKITLEAGDFSAIRITIYTKTGNGTETEADFYLAEENNWAGGVSISRITAADVADIIDVSDTVQSEATADITALSVTTTESDTLILWCYIQDDDTATLGDVDSDVGFSGTLRGFEQVGSGESNGLCIGVSTAAQAAAEASDTCVFSMNGDTEAACAITVAIRSPAAGGLSIPIAAHHYRQMQGIG